VLCHAGEKGSPKKLGESSGSPGSIARTFMD